MIYGLNMTRFKIKDKKQCRDLFNIPMDAHVIAFRFMGENDKLKGWVYIKEALGAMTLTKPTYIITTQMKGISKFLDKKFTCIELGFVPDSEMIVDVMNAADLFLMPSEAESYGMMAIESMACGTPVIVFEGTSLADIIHAPNGGIAIPKSSDALMRAIEDLLNDHNKYDTIVRNGLDIVKNEYDAEKCVKVNVDVYETLIDRST
jgi:glycosyltransferase involved in cell wall biosynthesis